MKILGTRRDLDEAHRPRPRLQRHREGEDRGGRRHLLRLIEGLAADAPDDRQRVRDPGHPPEAAVHGGDPGALPARRLHPGARASTSTRRGRSRTTSPAATSSASSTSSRAEASRACRLFALGIMPYITASIILQLLTVVVPSLERLQKEGEVGQQKITQYTRYLTVGLAFAPVGRLRLPLPVSSGFGGGDSVVGELTFAKRDADRDHADRGLHAADVDGRADHPARHRQRDLADDLRLDRRPGCPAGSSRGGPTPTRSSS